MKIYQGTMAAEYDELLARLEVELCAVLRAREEHPLGAGNGEVSDFKDLADRESQEAVDEIQAEHAALELEQVIAARRRIQDQTYGTCVDCGETIDLRRLAAMPATPYCTSCQSRHEQRIEPLRHQAALRIQSQRTTRFPAGTCAPSSTPTRH